MKLTVVEASEQGKTSYSLSGLTPFPLRYSKGTLKYDSFFWVFSFE
jgi:hypothetical protein